MDLRSLQYLNLSGLPSLTLFMQLNPSGLMAWHRRSERHQLTAVIDSRQTNSARLTQVAVLPIRVPPVPLLLADRRAYDLLAVVLLAVWKVDSPAVQSHLPNGFSTYATFAMRLAAPVPSPVPTTVGAATHKHHVPHRGHAFLNFSEDKLLIRRRNRSNPSELMLEADPRRVS